MGERGGDALGYEETQEVVEQVEDEEERRGKGGGGGGLLMERKERREEIRVWGNPRGGGRGVARAFLPWAAAQGKKVAHHVDISLDPSACIYQVPTSSRFLTDKKQFPHKVFCLDFHSSLSFGVLVGASSVCVSENSSDDSDMCCPG